MADSKKCKGQSCARCGVLGEQHVKIEKLEQERKQYRDALRQGCEYAYLVDVTEGIVKMEDYMDDKRYSSYNLELTYPVTFDELISAWKKKYNPQFISDLQMEKLDCEYLLKSYEDGRKTIEIEYYEPLMDNYYQLTILLTENDSNGHVLASASGRNITQRRKHDEEIKKSMKMALDEANRANHAKSAFLSRMSHDIRTPINGILGMMEIAQENKNNQKKVEDCFEKMKQSAEHLLLLVNNILDMNKLEKGEIELEATNFCMTEVLDDVIGITQGAITGKGLHLTRTNENFLHVNLKGSEVHLRQILLNIITNAIKYNKEGGEIRCYATEIASLSNMATYHFIIQDTGIGMSQEFQEHMYEPFSQEEDWHRLSYHGTGLGLAIVKHLVDCMGGTICVKSKKGEGTTFHVVLPFEIQPETHSESKKHGDKDYDFTGMKILFAEDNVCNQEIVQYILQKANVEVDIVSNGKAALEHFAGSEENYYDVILLDIMMPVMDGLTAARKIRLLSRKDAASIPIVAMTANAFTEDVKRCKEAGMQAYMAKPVEKKEILSILNQYYPSK